MATLWLAVCQREGSQGLVSDLALVKKVMSNLVTVAGAFSKKTADCTHYRVKFVQCRYCWDCPLYGIAMCLHLGGCQSMELNRNYSNMFALSKVTAIGKCS